MSAPNAFGQGLWGQTPFGGDPGDPPDASVELSELLANLYPRLHAAGASDLIFTSKDELIAWAQKTLLHLARTAGVFVERSVTATVAGQPTYPLPVDHVSTLQATYDGLPLRPSATTELIAEDDAYSVTQGPVKRWYQDQIGEALIGLYQVPGAAKVLVIVHHFTPEALTSDKSKLPVPLALLGYFQDSVLSEAYGKQSDAMMPEAAAFLRSKCSLFEQVIQEYWGPSQ